jgi:ankyrin repeat protein
MGCTHTENCELYAQFALNPALQIWQMHYCQGEHGRCVRYQMSLRKEPVPLNMLPNGTRVEMPRSTNDYSATALFNAILKSRLPLLESLLKNGVDVNVRNSDGMTPLMAAASSGNLDMIRLLLDKGADTGVANNLGERASDVAMRYGHANVANILQTIGSKTASASPAATSGKTGGWLNRLRSSH